MSTNVIPHSARTAGRTAMALRSLMQIWEDDALVEEEETETELMVLLSGMVSPDATALSVE